MMESNTDSAGEDEPLVPSVFDGYSSRVSKGAQASKARVALAQGHDRLDATGNFFSDSFTSLMDEATGLLTLFTVYNTDALHKLYMAALIIYCINVAMRFLVGLYALCLPPKGVGVVRSTLTGKVSWGTIFRMIGGIFLIMLEPVSGIRLINSVFEPTQTLSADERKHLADTAIAANNSAIDAAAKLRVASNQVQLTNDLIQEEEATGFGLDPEFGIEDEADMSLYERLQRNLAEEVVVVQLEVKVDTRVSAFLKKNANAVQTVADMKTEEKTLRKEIKQLRMNEMVEVVMVLFEDVPELALGIAFIALGGLEVSSTSDISLFVTSEVVSIFHAAKCCWAWYKHRRLIRNAKRFTHNEPTTYDGYFESPQTLDAKTLAEAKALARIRTNPKSRRDGEELMMPGSILENFSDYDEAWIKQTMAKALDGSKASSEKREKLEEKMKTLETDAKKNSEENSEILAVLRIRKMAKDDMEAEIKRLKFKAEQKVKFGLDGGLNVLTESQLAAHMNTLKANGMNGYIREYTTIMEGRGATALVAKAPENKKLNRYNNIIAYDHSRVKLMTPNEDTYNSDYINASYIPGHSGNYNHYICTQGPVPASQAGFWQMVWENKCEVIVMVTDEVEGGKMKCHRYWPDSPEEVALGGQNPKQFGGFTVSAISEEVLPTYVTRVFDLKDARSGKTRKIVHFLYTAWPDHGVPDTSSEMVIFLFLVRAARRSLDTPAAPLVVHCSAGVGRSGCFIGLDYVVDQMQGQGGVDVLGCVREMRAHRNYMVQAQAQYVYLYETALDMWPQATAEKLTLRKVQEGYDISN
eukprot:gene9527-17272_t